LQCTTTVYESNALLSCTLIQNTISDLKHTLSLFLLKVLFWPYFHSSHVHEPAFSVQRQSFTCDPTRTTRVLTRHWHIVTGATQAEGSCPFPTATPSARIIPTPGACCEWGAVSAPHSQSPASENFSTFLGSSPLAEPLHVSLRPLSSVCMLTDSTWVPPSECAPWLDAWAAAETGNEVRAMVLRTRVEARESVRKAQPTPNRLVRNSSKVRAKESTMNKVAFAAFRSCKLLSSDPTDMPNPASAAQ
jgi:hypothetical protein